VVFDSHSPLHSSFVIVMISISFNDIKKIFNEEDWDVGYLTGDDLKRCAYHPVKYVSLHGVENYCSGETIHFTDLTNSIVLIRRGHTWDYTIYDESRGIINQIREQGAVCWNIHTNYKEAAILSGLGVRARNSLIYSYKFGFDHHITVFRFENEITDVPSNRRQNYKIWNRCVGCDDCAKACPVGAIHNKEKEPFAWWIDSEKCEDFISYGDHPTIPSVKQFWHKNVYPELSKKQVDQMTGQQKTVDFYAKHGVEWTTIPFDRNGYKYDGQIVTKNGVEVDVPVCRECTSQPRCSKWGGKYPYERIHDRKPK